jgi:uncharacterized protein (TIGR02001 family)
VGHEERMMTVFQTMFPTHAVRVLASAGLLALAVPAAAQDDAPAVKITGSAAFVSDYRFRGISFSDLDPAPQAFIQLTTQPGFFISAWGSSIADFNGATTEIDLTAGWTGSVGGVTPTIGAIWYTYPGGRGTNTIELFGSVAVPLGPVTGTFGLNWSPDQANLSRSSRYVFGTLAASIPNTPITLKGTLGHERGGLVVDESGRTTQKLDWLIGADIAFAPLTLGIAYVGNDLPRNSISDGEGGSFRANRLAKDGIVLSITASF